MKPTPYLFCLLALTACSSAPLKPEIQKAGDSTYLKAYLGWLIEEQMAKHDVTGLSIAVVDDQRVIWAQGFGYADAAMDKAASSETVYRVGSISKLFTDALIMQLAERGKLDIDQPLTRYLPEFAIKTRFEGKNPITPRNLMTHHSGLPGDVGHGMWTERPAPFGQLATRLKDDYAAYPPNTIAAYSNLGITLLGTMLERQTGEDFAAYAERQLLKPLGMTQASFAADLAGPSLSKAYKEGEETSELPLRDIPAGGLTACVLDLSRFMSMVFAEGRANGKEVLQAHTLKTMLSPQNQGVKLDFDLKTGLGWFLREDAQLGSLAEHGGATLYHNSLLTLSPEHKLGVVTLANSRFGGNGLRIINDAALQLALASRNGTQPDLDRPAPAIETRALTDAERRDLAGHYATGLGYVDLSNQSGSLVTDLNGKTLDLVMRDDGKYGLRYLLLGMLPIQPDELAEIGLSLNPAEGHDVLLAHVKGQRFVLGEKIQPAAIPASWQSRLGEYEIVNADAGEGLIPKHCALRERNGILLMEFSLPEVGIDLVDYPLATLSDREAVIQGLGRGMRETVRVIDVGGEEQVAYSGYLLRKKTAQAD